MGHDPFGWGPRPLVHGCLDPRCMGAATHGAWRP
ncbi:uncharacterized protein G2W53_040124 [Senna tora]|uniref:Uncharacterized protein n=1 Tax=Senna tora TaxID=362788 RepID=A0A834W491_9FABA|nr:uncharacterized protein G2W53_040124 [Senna tora]